jgi:hypothetical protein
MKKSSLSESQDSQISNKENNKISYVKNNQKKYSMKRFQHQELLLKLLPEKENKGR